MKIKWLQDVNMEVVTGYDERLDEAITELECFKNGEIHDVDILDRTEPNKFTKVMVDMQFGDGSVAYGVEEDLFKEVISIPKCPVCNGEMEKSETEGLFNCYFCGLTNHK